MTFEFPPRHDYGPPARRTALPWTDPPPNEVGMPVGFRIRVGEGSSHLTLGWFVAYSTGFQFHTVASLTMSDAQRHDRVREGWAKLLAGLELEMVWTDGRTLRPRSISERQPDGPVLTRRSEGGSGGDTHWRERNSWFVSPVPPVGRLAIVVRWPEAGIEGDVLEIDPARIRAASGQAVQFWRA